MTDPILLFASLGIIVGGVGLAMSVWYVYKSRKQFDVGRALDAVLFQVLVAQDEIPAPGEQRQKDPKEAMIIMEQFFAALSTLKQSRWHTVWYGTPSVACEIALPHVGEEVIFYAAVPRAYAAFFQNQLHSFFPSSKVLEVVDYNIFHPSGITVGSIAALKKNPILSLRTYRDLGDDPLGVITGAFAKLKTVGDGAALQFVIRPARVTRYESGKKIAQKIRSGATLKDALRDSSPTRHVTELVRGSQKKPDEKMSGDEELARQIEAKASLPAFDLNIRLVASAPTHQEAATILQGLEASLAQFNNPQGNEFVFRRLSGSALENMTYHFSFRFFNERESIYLSSAELSGLYHLPYGGFSQQKIMYLRAREAPPPPNVPAEGMLIGHSVFRGETRDVYITDDDRRRHMYVIGQTGTGKTTMIKEMAIRDIEAGHGVCFLDPHGQDIESILECIPEKRASDVIYFNPADIERPIGLNFLEYDPHFPEQKTFIVNELLEIFQKLYGAVPESLGPMFQQYFRNATMLIMEDPSSGSTLLEIGRVLTDKEFRDHKLSRSSNLIVNMFWKKIAEKAGGESSLQNMVPYITSKTDTFVANDIMRPIIGQEHSAFNFREIMDDQKILLINLSKGRLGELNSYLLGLIFVGKILMASLSRTDIAEHARKDFYFYIDEFQNVTTNSISTILSEARKYRLDLIVAHQFLGQLTDDIKKSVFGNVGTIVSFRVGSDDGEFMEKQFSPVFTAKDLLGIENHNAYIKLLIHGEPARAFNIKVYPPMSGETARKQKIVELSRMKYGRPREEIETVIRARYA